MEGGLLRDEDWRPLDGEICRVLTFTPLAARVEQDGRVTSAGRGFPYASIEIESSGLAEPTTAFITHKVDFQHLWQAFNVRGVADDEEVIVFWSKSNLRRPARWFSRSMPGLRIWVCPKHAYEINTDPNFRPELSDGEKMEASRPIAKWEPEVLQ